MADKASRALVLYGDGLSPSIDPSSHTHLHSLASQALCGFLSLPNAPPSESEDERIVRESAVLLDSCEAYYITDGQRNDGSEAQNKSLVTTISDRFMGLRAAIVTNNPSLKSFSCKLGFTAMQLNELTNESQSVEKSPPDVPAMVLLKLLGFQDGKASDTSQFDLVFVHIGAGEDLPGNNKALAEGAEYINGLVGGIMSLAPSGSEIGSRLHLSVLMSYGNVSEGLDSNLSVLVCEDGRDCDVRLFPRQSYTMRGEEPRKDVRNHSPILIAQLQYAVTRKDMADSFSFKAFKEHGGNLVIPADRLVHEIAFKLWKAPKYGA